VTPPAFPGTIDPSTPTVVLPGQITTNAGRRVQARVICAPLRPGVRTTSAGAPAGDLRYCVIRTSRKGKVTVTVLNPPVRVSVILTAPGTAQYQPYRKVKSWVVR
jgi:hypothetical protein